MIAVQGGLADVERDLIRTRTAEGRSRAQARGQHMGRPLKLTPLQQAEARKRQAEGATLQELARSYNVAQATISRLGPDRRMAMPGRCCTGVATPYDFHLRVRLFARRVAA